MLNHEPICVAIDKTQNRIFWSIFALRPCEFMYFLSYFLAELSFLGFTKRYSFCWQKGGYFWSECWHHRLINIVHVWRGTRGCKLDQPKVHVGETFIIVADFCITTATLRSCLAFQLNTPYVLKGECWWDVRDSISYGSCRYLNDRIYILSISCLINFYSKLNMYESACDPFT